MTLFTHCPVCKKWKLWISRKPFYSKALHTTLTPNNEICSKCIKIYKNIENPNVNN